MFSPLLVYISIIALITFCCYNNKVCLWLSLPLFLEAETVLFLRDCLISKSTRFSGVIFVGCLAAEYETRPIGRNTPQQPHHLILHSLDDLILDIKYLKNRREDLEMLSQMFVGPFYGITA